MLQLYYKTPLNPGEDPCVLKKRLRISLVFLLVAIALGGLGACGQKGPLYLPEEDQEDQEEKEKIERQSLSLSAASHLA